MKCPLCEYETSYLLTHRQAALSIMASHLYIDHGLAKWKGLFPCRICWKTYSNIQNLVEIHMRDDCYDHLGAVLHAYLLGVEIDAQ